MSFRYCCTMLKYLILLYYAEILDRKMKKALQFDTIRQFLACLGDQREASRLHTTLL